MNPPIPTMPCCGCGTETCEIQYVNGVSCRKCYEENNTKFSAAELQRLRAENEALRIVNQDLLVNLQRSLKEAIDWIDAYNGCNPSEISDYDGWAGKAQEAIDRAMKG
jgi:reverse gyrase